MADLSMTFERGDLRVAFFVGYTEGEILESPVIE